MDSINRYWLYHPNKVVDQGWEDWFNSEHYEQVNGSRDEFINKLLLENHELKTKLLLSLQQARQPEGRETATVSPLQGHMPDSRWCPVHGADHLSQSKDSAPMRHGGEGCECAD